MKNNDLIAKHIRNFIDERPCSEASCWGCGEFLSLPVPRTPAAVQLHALGWRMLNHKQGGSRLMCPTCTGGYRGIAGWEVVE